MSATVRALPGVRQHSADAVLALLDAAVTQADSPEALAALLGGVERVKAAGWARLLALSAAPLPANSEPDRLVDAAEAARLLGRSKDYVYGHARVFPFTVRGDGRAVRFSLGGIQRYIREHQGA